MRLTNNLFFLLGPAIWALALLQVYWLSNGPPIKSPFARTSFPGTPHWLKPSRIAPYVATPEQITSLPSVVLLAVKPNDMALVCQQLASIELAPETLFISIAAGIPISAFQSWLGEHSSIVRCMPNTPAAIGLGMTGIFTTIEYQRY